MNYLKRFVLFFIFVYSTSFAETSFDAKTALNEILNSFHSMTADFQQVTSNSEGLILEKASGHMAILRPHEFRWETIKPNQQLIVMNEKNVWIYDIDLEQVSVHPVKNSNQESPAMLLTGSLGEISQHYRINGSKDKNNTEIFTLVPLKEDNLFRRLTMRFNHTMLIEMVFQDQLNQQVKISFSHVERNPSISQSQFEFKPPKGVDVIGTPS